MLNIIYAGTPDVAVPPLDYLANSDKVRVVGVLTREDAPVGRKRVLTPLPGRAARRRARPAHREGKPLERLKPPQPSPN